MGVEGFLSTEDERAARQLVEQADLILQATDGSVPAQFASRLFGRAVAEDVRLYTAHELASLALGAYGHLAARRPGRPISASNCRACRTARASGSARSR